MIRDLLPIGSIVRLKEGVKRLMVFGIKQTEETSGIEYDYIGVLYPEGNVGLDFQYMFSHEDIETVFFEGFIDEEREKFIEQLNDVYCMTPFD